LSALGDRGDDDDREAISSGDRDSAQRRDEAVGDDGLPAAVEDDEGLGRDWEERSDDDRLGCGTTNV
jgi:hypothetical protein